MRKFYYLSYRNEKRRSFIVGINHSESNPEGSGYQKLLPGCYHFKIDDAKEEDGKYGPQVCMDLEAIGSRVDEEAGKTMRDFLSLDGKAAGRTSLIVQAIGLVTLEQMKADKEAGNETEVDWAEAVGRQFCMKIEEYTKQDKTTGVRGTFEIMSVDVGLEQGYPVNVGLVGREMIVSGGQSSTQSPPPPHATDDLGDL